MIDRFGQVMLYVKDIDAAARFWTEKMDFTKLGAGDGTAPDENGLPWVELTPAVGDTSLVLFPQKEIAAREPETNLGTPSILFSTYDAQGAYNALHARGVKTDAMADMGGMKTFAFGDGEGHWFAMREIARPGKEV